MAKIGGCYAMNVTRFGDEMQERRQKFGYRVVRRVLGVFWYANILQFVVDYEA